jgi:serine/threonine protein kinase
MGEIPLDDANTLRESDGTATKPSGEVAARDASGLGVAGLTGTFRGRAVRQQLPTSGAEADIYLLEFGDELRVLKLYRYSLAPRGGVLDKVAEVSRRNSRALVVFFESGYDEETGRWYELLEYMPLGSLLDISLETKRSHHVISQIVRQMAEAIHCLHENDIIHCDIKPSNILIRNFEPLDLVLTDFGISSIIDAGESRKMTTIKGTPMYWAPEAFNRSVGRSCDWWGLGMILLELLACEHPFERMSTSMIMHKLTLSNVDVPDFIGPEWGMLVKGLLTKDDSKRWKYAEVMRWLAGERNIPVFYEAPEERRAEPEATAPFTFDGTDHCSPSTLAEAMAASELPWTAPGEMIKYIRIWLEKIGLGDAADDLWEGGDPVEDPQMALFVFTHRFAVMPFRLLGRVVDTESLFLFLMRAEGKNASMMEGRIIEMLNNGKLAAFYDVYARTRSADPDFRRLLSFLSGKPRHFQIGALRAILKPDEYVWPDETSTESLEAMDFFERAARVPIRREDFDSLDSVYLLPKFILDGLSDADTYGESLDRLSSWRAKGALLPASADQKYREADLSSYERVADEINLKRASSETEPIAEAADELEEYLSHMPYLSFEDALRHLKGLSKKNITARDEKFIGSFMEKIRAAREAKGRTWAEIMRWTCACGTACFIIYVVMGLGVNIPRPRDFILAGLFLFLPTAITLPFASDYNVASFRQALGIIVGLLTEQPDDPAEDQEDGEALASSVLDGSALSRYRSRFKALAIAAAAVASVVVIAALMMGSSRLYPLSAFLGMFIFPVCGGALSASAFYAAREYREWLLRFDVALLCRDYANGLAKTDEAER